jgi:hypothetical protein
MIKIMQIDRLNVMVLMHSLVMIAIQFVHLADVWHIV